MNLPVTFDTRTDYQFTAYELYKYPKDILLLLERSLTRLNQIKYRYGLEQGVVNYLEAVALSALLACDRNTVIASMIPNILGETLRTTFTEAGQIVEQIFSEDFSEDRFTAHWQQYRLLPFYALGDIELTALAGLRSLPLTVLAQFRLGMQSDTKQLIDSYLAQSTPLNLLFVYQSEDYSIEYLQQMFVTSREVHVGKIESYNLLEAYDQIFSSGKLVNLLFIPVSYANSPYHPLMIYQDQLKQRKLYLENEISEEQLLSYQPAFFSIPDSSVLEDELPVPVAASLLQIVLNETENKLTGLKVVSKKLDNYLLAINQFPLLPSIALQVRSEDFSELSIGLILQQLRRNKGELVISYEEEGDRENFLGVQIIERTCAAACHELRQSEYCYSAPGEDCTILTWGSITGEVFQNILGELNFEPELIVLKKLWPLPIELIRESVANTSRLIIIPDPLLSFPLVDIYINQLQSSLYQLLDAPIRVISRDLLNSALELEQLLYEKNN